MNTIQNYGGVNVNTNYGKVNKVPNFKALNMPPKDKFVKLGEKCMEELETARPKFEKIANYIFTSFII